MSSHARRSLRTTVAAAGIAALGVGLAGHAFAAPELPAAPALPGTEGLGTLEEMAAAPDLAAAPEMPAAPSAEGFTMPGVINFETPTVSTAGPELPTLDAFAVPTAPELPAMPGAPAAPEAPSADALTAPEAPSAPEAPNTDGIVNSDLEFGNGESAEAETVDNQVAEDNQMDAMQALDMAAFAMEMAQGAAAGESVTQNQQIG